jgi:hypothetical protein
MSGPVDHRAEAVRLARKSEETIAHVYGQSADAAVLAHLSEVHATLACAPPDPELHQLIAAAQNVLAHVETQPGTGYVRVPDEYLTALQTCVLRSQGFEPEDAPPPPPPDPPRKPSAKFHKQGTVIPDGSS